MRREWKAEIEQETIVPPDSDVVVRFLLLHDSHETEAKVERLDSTAVAVGLIEEYGNPTLEHWSYVWDGHR